jgi:hypothetical protein
MKRFRTKKALITGAAFVLILAAGGAAFAYFTSSGSGTGSAQTGTASNVTISQIGAGYDSLISTGAYSQDQCFACDGPNELGNSVTLSTTDAAQLVNVVVAVDNWGAAETDVPMTLSINNSLGGGPISDTQDFSFPAAINPSSQPSETNVTFDFSSQGAFVGPSLVYGITFNTTPGAAAEASAGSLNVALSSSATDLSVGSDTNPGSVWLDDTHGNNNDFPACTSSAALSAGVFEQVATNCGPWNPDNPGAYGNEAVTDDIPAVEVTVVGGTVTGLYPGGAAQPLEYAITNPGTGPVHVDSLTASVDTNSGTGDVTTAGGADVTGCSASWYPITNSPQALGATIPPGTTLFTTTSATATILSIKMIDSNTNQDACEGAVVGLSFTSN